jgi:hypothetical protein
MIVDQASLSAGRSTRYAQSKSSENAGAILFMISLAMCSIVAGSSGSWWALRNPNPPVVCSVCSQNIAISMLDEMLPIDLPGGYIYAIGIFETTDHGN